MVDPVQYRARVEDFDFDMTIDRFSMSATPGDSLRRSSRRRRPPQRDRTTSPASPTRWSMR
jgi:ABC-type oligopeptide transport system substrate-binding subunit